MNNLDKLTQAGRIVFGDNWQSPMARLIGVDDRSVRRYVSGNSRPPPTGKLLDALERKRTEIDRAIFIVKHDAMLGENVTINVIKDILNNYNYADEHEYKSAFDEVNNNVYETTYLSDLHQIAKKWAEKNG